MNLFYRIDGEKDWYTFVIDIDINPITDLPTVGSIYRELTTDRYTITQVVSYSHYVYIEAQKTTA